MSWTLLRRQSRAPLLQWLRRAEMHRGAWRLRLEEDLRENEERAEVWLEAGWVVHAEWNGLVGEAAATALLTRPRLRFAATHGLPVPRRTLHSSIDGLLDHARQSAAQPAAIGVSQPASPPL